MDMELDNSNKDWQETVAEPGKNSNLNIGRIKGKQHNSEMEQGIIKSFW